MSASAVYVAMANVSIASIAGVGTPSATIARNSRDPMSRSSGVHGAPLSSTKNAADALRYSGLSMPLRPSSDSAISASLSR